MKRRVSYLIAASAPPPPDGVWRGLQEKATNRWAEGPRCWPEPSCYDSAAAFTTRSVKHSHVWGRRQRLHEVLPRESHGQVESSDDPPAAVQI